MLSAPLVGGQCVIVAADCSPHHGMTVPAAGATVATIPLDTEVSVDIGISGTVCSVVYNACEYELPLIRDEHRKPGMSRSL